MKKTKKNPPAFRLTQPRNPRATKPRRRPPHGWRWRATRRAASGLPRAFTLTPPCRGGPVGRTFFSKKMNNNIKGGSLPPRSSLAPYSVYIAGRKKVNAYCGCGKASAPPLYGGSAPVTPPPVFQSVTFSASVLSFLSALPSLY